MLVASEFAGESKPIQLRNAILIYDGNGQAAATINEVTLDENSRPVISSGRALTHADLNGVLNKMEPEKVAPKARKLAPANLLGIGEDWLMWWQPSQRRKIFFQTGNKQLNADLNGRDVLHPALLFLAQAKGGLSVWAMAQQTRPHEKTLLFQAPYLNFYGSGHLCAGTYRNPKHFRTDGIPKWETGFYETHFSHTNMDQRKLCSHPHGHDALWREMEKSTLKQFPAKYLAPMKTKDGKKQMTVAEALAL